MTQQTKPDVPRDVDWTRAQATIRARITALRERQEAEAQKQEDAK